MHKKENLPQALAFAINNVYIPAGIILTSPPKPEKPPEGKPYSAYRMGLNGYNVAFRVAKTTPHRPGNFITT